MAFTSCLLFFRSDCFIQVYKVVTSGSTMCAVAKAHVCLEGLLFCLTLALWYFSHWLPFSLVCQASVRLSHSCKCCCSWLCRLDSKYWLSSLCLHPFSCWQSHSVEATGIWTASGVPHLHILFTSHFSVVFIRFCYQPWGPEWSLSRVDTVPLQSL